MQNTDYVALLNEWAVGFYTELDFLNEASNQIQMKELMKIVPGASSPGCRPEAAMRGPGWGRKSARLAAGA